MQVCVVREGEVVAEAAVGCEPGTLFFAASAAKGVAATMVHRLGVDLDAPIAGLRAPVTLRHVLTHTAGLPFLWPEVTPEDLCDRERVWAFLAAEEPAWAPGTATGYHALTYGFLVDEAVRQATGSPLGAALPEDVFFGVPSDQLPRVIAQAGPDPPAPEPGSPPDRAVPPAVQPTAAFVNREDVLRADIPSQGTMTARAVARMYAGLLERPDVRELARPAFSGTDRVMGMETTWALGYSPARLGVGPRPGSTIGMVGSNGSVAYGDADSGVAVAVLRNRVAMDVETAAGIDLIVDAAVS